MCSKRITLGSIYMAAELYMLTDYSPDFVDTRDFVHRQVADAESAGSPVSFAMKHVRLSICRASGVRWLSIACAHFPAMNWGD